MSKERLENEEIIKDNDQVEVEVEEKEDVDFQLDGCDIGNSPSINFSKKIPRDSNEDDD